MNRKYKIALAFCASGVLLDQAAKGLVIENLKSIRTFPVIPDIVELHFARNTGMAFGLLQDIPQGWRIPFFTLITAVAVAIISHLLRQAGPLCIRFPAALGMILAGAFGNLIDRFRWGYVVDFVRVTYWPPDKHWPIFNLADALITVGIGLLVIDTLFSGEEEETKQAPDGPDPQPPGSGDQAADEAAGRPEASA